MTRCVWRFAGGLFLGVCGWILLDLAFYVLPDRGMPYLSVRHHVHVLVVVAALAFFRAADSQITRR